MSPSITNQESKKLYLFVFVLFFFSGLSGLVYQIVWTRELVLIFGNTMLAASTVLSAYMAGLAAGSFFAGKYADKHPRFLLRVYAVLEAGIGLYALLFPLLLALIGPLYTSLYRAMAGNILVVNLVRFIICFLLIIVPTFLMGASLPVLLKRFARSTGTLGKHMGLFYGINTVGAVAGTLVCGFILLRYLGMRKATFVAVAVNLAVAVLAWLLGRADSKAAVSAAPAAEEATAATSLDDQEEHPTAVKLVLLGIAISGFCALSYEVFWTRMLNLFFHNTVYSFTTMLAAFLVGIALGSLIYAKFLANNRYKFHLFVVVEIGIGILAYVTPFIFNLLYNPLFSKSAGLLVILKAIVIMLLPTLLMGIALPLAVQICQRGPKREGESVGNVYALNTVGSIFGAFAAGFILMPGLGIHRSVIAVVALNIIAGLLVLFALVRSRARLVYAVVFACLLIISFIAAPADIFRNLYERNQPNAKLLYYKEGKIANVVVYDFYKNGYKDLYLNGIEEASDRLWHVQLFKMLGVLPVVVHPQPDDALMVAFGAGMSAGACADLVKDFECAELNPDIYGEAEIFKKENRDVINNPNLKMVFNDGRNHLLLTPKKYSLIISDATNPLTFDSWTLYTKEFYELCKNRLKPGGVFCQWVPIPLPSDALKVILKTFKTVFPHASFWSIYGNSQCLMLGTPERLAIDYGELQKKLPPILEKTGLTGYGVGSADKFLSFFLLGEDELEAYLADFNTINTDDLPGAQFHGGHNREGMETALSLLKYQQTIEPYLVNTGSEDEKKMLRASLENYKVISRMLNLGYLQENESKFQEARAFAQASDAALASDQNITCMLGYGPVRKAYFNERVEKFPEDANAHNSLGYIAWQEKDYGKAIAEFQRALDLKQDFINAVVNLGQVLIDAGRLEEGVATLIVARELNPTLNVLNIVRNELNIVHTIRKLKYQKDEPSLYVMLGGGFLERRLFDRAMASFKAALVLDQTNQNALAAMGSVYETLGMLDKAVEYYERLALHYPETPNLLNKIDQLKLIRSNADAQADWLDSLIELPKPDNSHPEGCMRAFKKWTTYDFDGSINRRDLWEAATEFEDVIRADKNHMHAYSDAALIYECLGDYMHAAEIWKQGLEVSPGNENAISNITRLQLMTQIKEQGDRLSPQEKIDLFNQVGVLFWRAGHIETAIRYFRKALKLEPRHPMTWANLGANLMEAGQYPEAAHALELTLKLQPDLEFAGQIQVQLNRLKIILEKAGKLSKN